MQNFVNFPLSRRVCHALVIRRVCHALVIAAATASIFAPPLVAQTDPAEAIAPSVVDPASGSEADAPAETKGSTAAAHLIFDSPQVQRWRIGLILQTPVTCTDGFATFPVPTDWPEQKVRVLEQKVDPAVTAWATRELPGGAKQVLVQMPRVLAGQTAEILFEVEIERYRILPPEDTSDLRIPTRPGRELRLYLGNSPYIDASDGRIRKASQELKAMEAANDWERVEQIYDYVREHVEYVEGDIKSASEALRDGKGDCEEMTSLFIALCRNAHVPARMVWIPEHCYPEFYLEDSTGHGSWFPCQAAGTRQFGRMDEYRPVLQKGDRFKVPEVRQPVRYINEFFRCDKKGKSNPRPEFIREQLGVEVPTAAPSVDLE